MAVMRDAGVFPISWQSPSYQELQYHMRWTTTGVKMLIKIDNTKKLAIVTFFANLYFYNHIGTLYQQTRGLSLLQVNSIWSIIVGTIFLAEVPTGVIADKIGRKWSIVTALFLQTLGEFFYFFAKDYS